MTSLSVFKNDDGIELVINTQTGEAYATQAGYVRMSGKAQSTISERMNSSHRLNEVKEAEVPTDAGLRSVRLIPASLVFKWLLKDNVDLAEKMGTVGATVFLHQLAGYSVTSTATPPKPTPEQTAEYEQYKERLVLVDRLLERMTLKVQFVELFTFIAEWKENNPQEFLDENGEFRDNKYFNYEASIVNSAYKKLFGNNKKKTCERVGIPYHEEITIRDYMPAVAMQALIKFEDIMRQLVTIQNFSPHLALDTSFKMLCNDIYWRKIQFPIIWEKEQSIKTPPTLTAEQFTGRYLTELKLINSKLASYERVYLFAVPNSHLEGYLSA